MGGGQSFFVTMLMTVVILFVVFLILREFMCWYWKINSTLATLGEISATNTKMLEQLQKIATSANNSPEQQKILAEAKKLEAQGEQSAQAARKMRLSTLTNRNVCPKCYKDFSTYIVSCDTCDVKLEPCEVVAQKA